MQPSPAIQQPSTLPELKTRYLVEVFFPTTGETHAFRWPTRRQANRCAKDFAPLPGSTSATAPRVTQSAVRGYVTFEGFKQVVVAE